MPLSQSIRLFREDRHNQIPCYLMEAAGQNMIMCVPGLDADLLKSLARGMFSLHCSKCFFTLCSRFLFFPWQSLSRDKTFQTDNDGNQVFKGHRWGCLRFGVPHVSVLGHYCSLCIWSPKFRRWKQEREKVSSVCSGTHLVSFGLNSFTLCFV